MVWLLKTGGRKEKTKEQRTDGQTENNDNLNIINYMSTYSIGKMKIKMQNKTYI